MPEQIDAALAGRLARVALANIEREYPHHEGILQTGPGDAPGPPRSMHPSFYGSFDWHSCVEMHWLLVRLLRTAAAGLPEGEIRAALHRHLAAEPLRAEAAFFARPEQRANERPYGWGWLLMLHHEAATWPDADAERWAEHLGPLADVLVRRLVEWLPQATYPVRHGVHENSAYALSCSLPEARWLAGRGEPRLLTAISAAATRWFGADRGYPAAWEPRRGLPLTRADRGRADGLPARPGRVCRVARRLPAGPGRVPAGDAVHARVVSDSAAGIPPTCTGST